MPEKKPADTVIMVHETVLQSWARDAGTLALFAALIGIGILADSSAMQWAGAIMAFITTCVRASGRVEQLSIAEARARLNALEGKSDG